MAGKGVVRASDLSGKSRKVRRLDVLSGREEQQSACGLVDLERCGLNTLLVDRMGVGEECRRP